MNNTCTTFFGLLSTALYMSSACLLFDADSGLEGERKHLVCKSLTSKPPRHLFWPVLSAHRQLLSASLSQLSSPPVRKIFTYFSLWKSPHWNFVDWHWGFLLKYLQADFWGVWNQLTSGSECLLKAASFCLVLPEQDYSSQSRALWFSVWQISICWVDY